MRQRPYAAAMLGVKQLVSGLFVRGALKLPAPLFFSASGCFVASAEILEPPGLFEVSHWNPGFTP